MRLGRKKQTEGMKGCVGGGNDMWGGGENGKSSELQILSRCQMMYTTDLQLPNKTELDAKSTPTEYC